MLSFDSDEPLSDPAIAGAIGRECGRQAGQIERIASENIVAAGMLRTCSSVLTDGYAEGCPGERYDGGRDDVDEVEPRAVERAVLAEESGPCRRSPLDR